jgi:hypothetical protein
LRSSHLDLLKNWPSEHRFHNSHFNNNWRLTNAIGLLWKIFIRFLTDWIMPNWVWESNSPMNFWESYARFSINAGSIFWISMDHGSGYPYTMKVSSCGRQSPSRKGKAHDPSEKNDGHNDMKSFRFSYDRQLFRSLNIWCGVVDWIYSTVNSGIPSRF